MKAMILETLEQGLQVPFDKAEDWAEIKAWLRGEPVLTEVKSQAPA